MLVPAVMTDVGTGELDESNPPLHETPGEQALTSVGLRLLILGLESIEAPGSLRLAGELDQLRNGGLHPEGKLVVADRRLDPIVPPVAGHGRGVEA